MYKIKEKKNEEMKAFVKENNWLPRTMGMDFGWGNGYVAIPKGHSLYGKDYNEIHDLIPSLDVNGGLTFSDTSDLFKSDDLPNDIEGHWVVGFDTSHSWDTLKMWSRERVIEETERLKSQLLNYEG